MPALALPVIPGTGTGSSVGVDRVESPALYEVAPFTLTLVGGLTCASIRDVPIEFPNSTSTHVIDLVRFIKAAHLGASASGVGELLEAVKSSSGLPWDRIASALGVAPRAVHLWRKGGGISANHEERLRSLRALIESVDTGVPTEVRGELLASGAAGSLLERLQAGESPSGLVREAPWRQHASEALTRNLAELADDEGVLDEDFLFLLHLDDDQVHHFTSRAQQLLTDPRASRRTWDDLFDQQFALVPTMAPAPDLVSDESGGNDMDELSPLFKVADLGIPLGVGAIGLPRPLHDGS